MKRLYSVASIIAFAVSAATPPLAQAAMVPHIAPLMKKPPISSKIAKSAKQEALKRSTVGWCYRGVKSALANVGITLTGSAAWMAREQLNNDRRFFLVPFKKLKIGDILVHGRNTAHPYGHIAVYLGNNLEASDHVQKLVVGRGYGATSIFRAKDHAFNGQPTKIAFSSDRNSGLGAGSDTITIAEPPALPSAKQQSGNANENTAANCTQPPPADEQQLVVGSRSLLNLFCLAQVITAAARLFV